MHFLTRFSLKNTAAVLILCIMVILGGSYSAMQMKKETMPDISIPIVAVVTVYPGAAPQDVRDKISDPMEKAMANLKGMKGVSSTSSENLSTVIAQFDYDADMKEAQRLVEESIKNVKVPEGAVAPKTLRVDMNSAPIVTLAFFNDKLDANSLAEAIQNKAVPEFNGVDGVGQVRLGQEVSKAVYVRLIPQKLKEYNLTSQQVTQLLQANNMALPAGSMTFGEVSSPLRVTGKLNSVEELRQMKLPVAPNTQAMMTDTFSQMGQGISGLSSAVGQLGQGLSGLSQVTQGQAKLLTALSDTQGKLFGAKVAVSDAKATLNSNLASAAEKQGAQAVIAQISPQIPMLEAAVSQIQTQLNALNNSIPQASASAPSPAPAAKQDKPAETTAPALKTVTLGEIADITVGSAEAKAFTRMNGASSVTVDVIKSQDGNTVDIADAVKDKLSDVLRQLPEGTRAEIVLNQADYVKRSVNGMLEEGLLGALFAFVVILLFLRNFRTTLIASISMPLSVFFTLTVLKQMDVSLNIMTLGGMSVAMGRIVDDSIVVIENIYRHLQERTLRTVDLIREATREVVSAITSSTITTVAVFLPIGMVGGFSGVIFRPFAITVSISLLSSLLVAVTVIPLLSRLLLLKTKPAAHAHDHEGPLMRVYVRLLKWALSHKPAVLLLALVLFAGSIGLLPLIGTSFMPSEKANHVVISLDYPAGTDIKTINARAKTIEEKLSGDKDVSTYQTSVISAGSSSGFGGGGMAGRSSGTISVLLKDGVSAETVAVRMKNAFSDDSKGKLTAVPSNPNNTNTGGTNGLEMVIKGKNIEDIRKVANQLTQDLGAVSGLSEVTNNLTDSKPEVAVSVNQEKAAARGLSAAQVGLALREMLNDNVVTTVTVDNVSRDVRVGLKMEAVAGVNAVSDIAISSPVGGALRVGDVAEVREVPGAVSIFTQDGYEYAKVTARITEKDTGAVSKEAQKKMDALTLPAGVTVKFGGVTAMMNESFQQLGIAMVVAVLAVFLVMVVALGEAIAPLAILFSLPLAAIGGFLALLITRLPLDMPGMIGALMLIGIVVTNAIVLIDRVQQRRREGMPVREALVEAGRVRMRPILMTAIATVAALIPLAVGISKSSVMSQSLAVVVIGGLLTSTFLTLVIVPVAYDLLEGIKARLTGTHAAPEQAGH